MPNNWLAVDSNLPDLTKVNDPKEQSRLLLNYMVALVEQLKYSLNNLSASNWNATALGELKVSVNEDTLRAVSDMQNRLTRFGASISEISGYVNGVENAVSELQLKEREISSAIQQLQIDDADTNRRIGELVCALYGEDGTGGIHKQLEDLQIEVYTLREEMDTINACICKTDEGVSLGSEDIVLHLKGTVYINGVLLEQKGEGE